MFQFLPLSLCLQLCSDSNLTEVRVDIFENPSILNEVTLICCAVFWRRVDFESIQLQIPLCYFVFSALITSSLRGNSLYHNLKFKYYQYEIWPLDPVLT